MALVAAMPSMGHAQNEADVLRYGWVAPLGSSRTMAMGGAFGALGADLGSMGINPAGLGMYRRGDLAISAGIHGSSTASQWGTRSQDASGVDVVAGNFGIALTYPSVDADWPFFTLAVGHQNRMPFTQRVEIDGVSTDNTVSDLFVSQALDDAAIYGYASTDEALSNGDIFGYTASLAWRTGLLLPDAQVDAGEDAGVDASFDAGTDAGMPPSPSNRSAFRSSAMNSGWGYRCS